MLDPHLMGPGRSGSPRARFLLDCLERLGADLARRGVPLVVRQGEPDRVLTELAAESGARLVSYGTSGTPYGRQRDALVRQGLEAAGIEVLERGDHGVLSGGRIRNGSGDGYRVYTPYRNAWWKTWHESPELPQPCPDLPTPIPGFEKDGAPALVDRLQEETRIGLPTGGERAARRRLTSFLEGPAARYHVDRDRPDLDGTSRLSPYLRFGTISARQCVALGLEARSQSPEARKGIDKWLDEIVWREFYQDVLLDRPDSLRENYRREYDAMQWNDDPEALAAWAEGATGYPIVDAGMRQLRQTGWMHNRVRMIVASFLTKDLLIHWREGERVFMELLVDGDPASNAGGWQWAASTGTDAQPYFRIFNPVTQAQRYDPEGRYVRKYVPELRSVPDEHVHDPWKLDRPPRRYPAPIVDHAERRKEALARFERARAEGAS